MFGKRKQPQRDTESDNPAQQGQPRTNPSAGVPGAGRQVPSPQPSPAQGPANPAAAAPSAPAGNLARPATPGGFGRPGAAAPHTNPLGANPGSTNPLGGAGVNPAATAPAGASAAQASASESDKKLIVGRSISLKGEIRRCDRLVVEGEVEADLNDSQALEISENGVFKGSATIRDAEIAGTFDGDLTVKERLFVRATGRVNGKIHYGRLEIENGGRIGGTLIEIEDKTNPDTR